MKMKKTWLILLSTLFVLLTLSACDGGTPAESTGEDTETAAPAADIPLISGGTTQYTIVRSDLASSAEVKAAVLLRSYMEKCGVKVGITTDWEKNPVSDYEIVIGDTLRTAEQGNTVEPHSVGEKGYFCYASGTRIYIGGGSEAALTRGVEAFLTEFFGYTGDPETASPVTELVIPGDYSVIQKQSYPITSFTVAGKDLSDYRIVVDSADLNLRSNAKTIQKMFYSECGIWMEIVGKNETWDGPALVLADKGLKKSRHFEVSVENGNLMMKSDLTDGHLRGIRFFFRDEITGKSGALALDASFKYDADVGSSVSYSEFGAVGDGKTNDLAAIIATHAYANANGIPVKADAGATYYISAADSGAIIQTDTDWTGASFIIDDSHVSADKRGVAIFNVTAGKATYNMNGAIKTVAKGAEKLDITLPEDSIVVLTEAGTKKYIREGVNQNDGSDQQDILVVDKNGNIDPAAPVIWEYKNVTSVKVIPMDEETLTLKGGTFTTIANQLHSSDGYFNRGIQIVRSNVVVDGITHYVEGERSDQGAPYYGILVISDCANITVKNCTFTGHKTYQWDKPTGTVSQGTYDISPSRVVNLTFENCKQTNDILDTSRWGIMGSNFCKNITLKNCEFSRFDAHQGVANVTIIGCTLGHQCLNAIGCGTLRVENTTLYGNSLINLRSDYGSTWEGDLIIKNCTWIPNKGKSLTGNYAIIGGKYTGFHDFGYECYMPANITIEGLHIDDSKAGSNYKGIYLFGDITEQNTSESYEQKVQAEGYPYHVTEKVTISGFTSVSGKKWNLSPNTYMFRNVEIVDGDK